MRQSRMANLGESSMWNVLARNLASKRKSGSRKAFAEPSSPTLHRGNWLPAKPGWQSEPSPVKRVSVVVPTHNRAAMLKAHLSALATQTFPRQATEWIIVCDGCIDDSAQVAREAGAAHVIEQAGAGPAAA